MISRVISRAIICMVGTRRAKAKLMGKSLCFFWSDSIRIMR